MQINNFKDISYTHFETLRVLLTFVIVLQNTYSKTEQ